MAGRIALASLLLKGIAKRCRSEHFGKSAKNQQPVDTIMNTLKSLATRTKAAALTLLLTASIALSAHVSSANEWIVDGDTVTAILEVGYDPEFVNFSGTVTVQMRNVIESGKMKIVTTILNVTPQPGFTYSIKKSGGVNGTVDIGFNSGACESRFSFLYKPGLTRIDYGVLRCR